MAEFTDVVVPTALGWVRGDNLPTGDTLLKLRCFLHIVGYRVDEFIDLPRPTRHFADLVAMGVLSVDDATEQLGYQNTKDLYRVLLRGQGLLTDKVHRLQRIVSDHEEQRRTLIDEWRSRLASRRMGVSDTPEESDVEVVGPPPVIEPPLAATLLVLNLETASKLLNQLSSGGGLWVGLARQLLEADLSAEQLEGLRVWLSTPSGEVGG